MQTFLPYPNFQKSAQCLDMRRLGKQRVEAYQLLNILLNRTTKKAWSNHPACLMWQGYENALKEYFNSVLMEWIKRGYKNNMLYETINVEYPILYPPWLGNEKFHASHRSNLLRKNKEYYSQFNWTESSDLPYIWPTKDLV
jgi:hypothetical protein